MNRVDELLTANQALRERLSRLSEASLRINESLDFNVVLQEVIDNARYLANARYGVISTMDEVGGLGTLLTSGTTEEEHRKLIGLPGGTKIFDHFRKIPGPLRLDNYPAYAVAAGLNDWLPMTVFAGMAAPIRHRANPWGSYGWAMPRKTRSSARRMQRPWSCSPHRQAMVISISRRYRDERRARSDLETLIRHLTRSALGSSTPEREPRCPINQECREDY